MNKIRIAFKGIQANSNEIVKYKYTLKVFNITEKNKFRILYALTFNEITFLYTIIGSFEEKEKLEFIIFVLQIK